jgi:hypothetical protein
MDTCVGIDLFVFVFQLYIELAKYIRVNRLPVK